MYKDEFKLAIPVLLVAFNRPDATKTVFNRIKDAKPSKLYFAVDGPRQNKEGERDQVTAVKNIVQQVDWSCKTHYKFNKENLGAEVTVSSAISWVLEKEEFVIILEDDILAPISFFRFTEEMLIKYKDEKKVCMVSGCNFTPMKTNKKEDYFFSKYGHIWGWGTWSRAWNKFDLNINDFTETIKYKNLRKTCESKTETKHFMKKYKRMMKKGVGNNTWDYCWGYIYRTNGLLSIVPQVNLTSNIGVYGLHSRGKTEHHFRSYDENFVVINHPSKIEKNVDYDNYHFKNYIKRLQSSTQKKIIKKIHKYFNKFFAKQTTAC